MKSKYVLIMVGAIAIIALIVAAYDLLTPRGQEQSVLEVRISMTPLGSIGCDGFFCGFRGVIEFRNTGTVAGEACGTIQINSPEGLIAETTVCNTIPANSFVAEPVEIGLSALHLNEYTWDWKA